MCVYAFGTNIQSMIPYFNVSQYFCHMIPYIKPMRRILKSNKHTKDKAAEIAQQLPPNLLYVMDDMSKSDVLLPGIENQVVVKLGENLSNAPSNQTS